MDLPVEWICHGLLKSVVIEIPIEIPIEHGSNSSATWDFYWDSAEIPF